nr:metallophosphoesterase [Kofleriaceae bacterium]
MRIPATVLALLAAACVYEPIDADPTSLANSIDDDSALVAIDPAVALEPVVAPEATREPLPGDDADTADTTGPQPWRFAVLSDLHLPNPRSAVVDREVAALIAMKVRFVVVTGDFTNGAEGVDHRRARVDAWWASVTTALAPLRDAGIPVLPIAGNHDTYLAWQRAGYERAFGDLEHWTSPLAIHPATGSGFARAPYSYSVDVDGVHLALANIVDQTVDHDVAAWLADDLAAASTARARIVFGHVPMVSVIAHPARHFVDQLGGILARGNAALYVAGHEHVSWDETFAVAGQAIRQVMVGCSSGFYVYGPAKAARARAGCAPTGSPGRLSCTMPNGGRFELVRDRSQRMIEHDPATFTVFTVTDGDVQAVPMTVDDDGHARAFYLVDANGDL